MLMTPDLGARRWVVEGKGQFQDSAQQVLGGDLRDRNDDRYRCSELASLVSLDRSMNTA